MNLKNLPWMTIGKVALAGLGAAGLIGTGYVAAPKETTASIDCKETVIKVPVKIYINGQEIKRK